MKISELAAKTGAPVPTIRFHEQVGLLDTRHVRRLSRYQSGTKQFCDRHIRE